MPPKEAKQDKKAPAAAPAAAPAPAATASKEAGDAEVAKDNNRGGRPRGKGREREHKGGRGGKEGEEGGRRPKREFDRRSGTGRGREVSRGGRGAFGAGNVDQDAHDAEKHPHEAKDVLEPVEPQTDAAEGEAQAEAEPEPAQVSFDDFIQQREASRAKLQSVVGPKSVRVVDKAAQFGDLEPKSDNDLDAYMPGTKGKHAVAKKDQRCSAKSVLDLGFRFASNPQPEFKPRGERGPRGGRGDGAGHFSRGEKREHKKASDSAPAFSNKDFPSL